MDIHPEIEYCQRIIQIIYFLKSFKIDSLNCRQSDVVLVHSEDMKNFS